MNDTDDLIAQLATSGAAQVEGALWRFALPLVFAALFCAAILLLTLGQPFAAVEIYGPVPLIVKWAFSLPLVIGGALALHALGQPGRNCARRLGFLAVPFIFAAVLLVLDILSASEASSGATWTSCLTAMATLSPVGFAAAIIATRWLAPTDLRKAGFAAGIFGGGLAMSAYSPFCPELGMVFMTLYYCLPVAVMAAIGWIAGPRLLRW